MSAIDVLTENVTSLSCSGNPLERALLTAALGFLRLPPRAPELRLRQPAVRTRALRSLQHLALHQPSVVAATVEMQRRAI